MCGGTRRQQCEKWALRGLNGRGFIRTGRGREGKAGAGGAGLEIKGGGEMYISWLLFALE